MQHAPTPADAAYAQGKYSTAEDAYAIALQQKPHDPELTAALVKTLLREDKLDDAQAQLRNALPDAPRSAALLTARAEVELKQGQPWLAKQTLEEAAAADPCYARAHLIRSRIFRIDSMYASQRAELQSAYDIDPKDTDIFRAWQQVVAPANDMQGIEKSLADSTIDAEVRQKGQASVDSMRTLLFENSQTCEVAPVKEAVTLPLMAIREDTRHISGATLEAQFPQNKLRLRLDTAASGVYIGRATAEANGLEHQPGDPADTVRAEVIRVGPIELHHCMVGVTDQPFMDRTDGFIGTDVFSDDLITLNFPASRMDLAPLPGPAPEIPGNRAAGGELSGYAPVYHRLQYLLIPVTLDGKEERLFALDSGIRLTTIVPDVAHLVSKTRINFTNAVQTTTGSTLQVYRDKFDFRFADLTVNGLGGLLEFDPAAVDQNTGMQIAGMIGFDMLQSLKVSLDYRDGLVKFESPGPGMEAAGGGALIASSAMGARGQAGASEECQPDANESMDWPLNTTIEGGVMGWMDSGHIKPGQTIILKAVHGWTDGSCELSQGALLYGRAIAVSKDGSGASLALVFDQAECSHKKQPLTMRVIGLVGPPGEYKGLHNAMPTEISGGARQISDTVANMDIALDQNLNPGGPPHTVHPGVVANVPSVALRPRGGPQCSTLLSSTQRSIHLGVGSEFILLVEHKQP